MSHILQMSLHTGRILKSQVTCVSVLLLLLPIPAAITTSLPPSPKAERRGALATRSPEMCWRKDDLVVSVLYCFQIDFLA